MCAAALSAQVKITCWCGTFLYVTVHAPFHAIYLFYNDIIISDDEPCLISLQTLVLSEGRMMYYGPPNELQSWFGEGLGYRYRPELHGLPSDWVMDLVNVRFRKPKR